MIWPSLVMLTVFTLITFINSWPNSLVFDDQYFVGPESTHPLGSLAEAFSRPLWGTQDELYRPLLSIEFELQNRMFGAWLEGYHLVNILLHLVTTLTLFGFVRYFLYARHSGDKNLDLYALLAALVFAVHPVHAEVVNSVFNKSSMYVSLAAIGGLWWLFSNLDTRPVGAWTGFGLVYCAAILFKESALVLPGIAAAMIVLLTDGDLKTRIRRFLPVFWLLIPIAIYFWARSMVVANAGINTAILSDEMTPLLGTTQYVADRSTVEGIAWFGKGLKVLAWPYPLRLFHGSMGEVAIAAYIGLQVLLAGWALYLLAKGRPVLAFALVFYYLAFLPSVRLIYFDNPPSYLSERYLYFPSVALTLALAFGFRTLATHLGRKTLALIMLPVLLTLAAISWDRNADWISEAQLFESEYHLGSRPEILLRNLIAAHYNQGRYKRVEEICDDNALNFNRSLGLTLACVSTYTKQARTEDAIAALELYAREGDEEWITARLQLVAIYLALKQPQEVAGQYIAIIDRLEEPAAKELYKGEMLLSLFPDDREQLEKARRVYQQALAMEPNLEAAQKRIKQIDRKLKETGAVSEPNDFN